MTPTIEPPSLQDLIAKVIDLFNNVGFALLPFVMITSIIISGINYMLAGDDASKKQKASQGITWAIMGTIIVLGAVIIVKIISSAIGKDPNSLTF